MLALNEWVFPRDFSIHMFCFAVTTDEIFGAHGTDPARNPTKTWLPETYRLQTTLPSLNTSTSSLPIIYQSLQIHTTGTAAIMPRQFFVGGNFKMSVLHGGVERAAPG
jgi:hypothetical protein